MEDPYGYTGLWYRSYTNLLFLRARWYAPYLNQFISPDMIIPDYSNPQSLNKYSYSLNNPINRLDPSGLQSIPIVPDIGAWTAHGGWEISHHPTGLQRIIDYRFDIIAAARRHAFVTTTICKATAVQLDLLYTLAAIIYRESYGYDEETASGEAHLANTMALYGISGPTGIPSVGIGQMRPNTAQELERAGLVYKPRSNDNKWLYIGQEPITSAPPESFNFGNDYIGGEAMAWGFVSQRPMYANQVARLLNPVWAIEYVAANMDNAQRQPDFNNSWHHLLNRPLEIWERMAAWYNRGVFRTEQAPEVVNYLDGTYSDKQAIHGTDLLGIKAECNNDCRDDTSIFP